MVKEIDLLSNQELRNRLAERYDVLEKVKHVITISDTDYCTTELVANFYDVGIETINSLIKDHRDEVESDGMITISGKKTKEILVKSSKDITNFRGYFIIDGIKFANRSNTLFPRRAILRVGMLLRDSEIAKEVRTQLLNIEERTDNEVKILDINEEQSLALALGMAYASGNQESIMIAHANLIDFKNRHIKKLTEENTVLQDENELLHSDNKALADGNLTWSDRSKMNYAVRSLAQTCDIGYGELWNELYKQLKYKHHIDVKKRAKKNFISTIKEDEWVYVVKTFASICEDLDVSMSELMKKVK